LFIQAVNEIRNEKSISYLDDHHIDKIYSFYTNFKAEKGFAEIIDNEKILKDKNARLSVQLFVEEVKENKDKFDELMFEWQQSSKSLIKKMDEVILVK